ncbi:hypothetical protein Fmac_013294 [Flemingia macrophylla]|uniref:Uncharacterized protein n=1 Tax=Flemingia macrophylla TaxID=520843 RepID=A0ABD1MSQ2_9FABA
MKNEEHPRLRVDLYGFMGVEFSCLSWIPASSVTIKWLEPLAVIILESGVVPLLGLFMLFVEETRS